MAKTFVADLDVAERRIFLRNDFNVPLDGGRITDDTRITAALPTFHFLLERGARIVCASHLGRPKGEVLPDCTLAPVARRLGERLGRKVEFCPETVGPRAEKAKAKLKPGQVLLLENLRFHPGETKNDPAFAAALAQGSDLYVDDAFGACHRAHASIAEITRHVKLAAAGFLSEPAGAPWTPAQVPQMARAGLYLWSASDSRAVLRIDDLRLEPAKPITADATCRIRDLVPPPASTPTGTMFPAASGSAAHSSPPTTTC